MMLFQFCNIYYIKMNSYEKYQLGSRHGQAHKKEMEVAWTAWAHAVKMWWQLSGTYCIHLQKFCYHHHFPCTSENWTVLCCTFLLLSAPPIQTIRHMVLPINVFDTDIDNNACLASKADQRIPGKILERYADSKI